MAKTSGYVQPAIINLANLVDGTRDDIRRELLQCDDARLASVLVKIEKYRDYGENEEAIMIHLLQSAFTMAFVFEARREMKKRLDSLSEPKAKGDTCSSRNVHAER